MHELASEVLRRAYRLVAIEFSKRPKVRQENSLLNLMENAIYVAATELSLLPATGLSREVQMIRSLSVVARGDRARSEDLRRYRMREFGSNLSVGSKVFFDITLCIGDDIGDLNNFNSKQWFLVDWQEGNITLKSIAGP